MQIREQNKPQVRGAVEYTADGKRVVMRMNTLDLTKDRTGKTYFSLLTGTKAYFFDNPYDRASNYILVEYGKGKSTLMSIPQFIIQLIYWRMNVVFNYKIDEKFIFSELEKGAANSRTFNNLINETAHYVIETEDAVTPQICDCIAKIKEELSEVSQNYSSIIGNTMSIWDIIQFRKRNKKFLELTETRLDKTKTIKELENQMRESEKELTSVVKNDDKNCLYPYVKAGRLKMAQLVKILVAVGTRPDVDKTILPWPVTRGYIHGLENAAEYFSETITARDAMMTKNDNLPRSGFLSREINRLTGTNKINYGLDDCGNNRYLNYKVENIHYLAMVKGKYFYNEKTEKEELVTSEHADLIGKNIKIRTMITCKCKNGICKKCVGKTAMRLEGTNLGGLPAVKEINPLSQKALSAKHDLGTKSIAITNDTLRDYCYHDGMDFFIKPEYATSKDLYIVIAQDDIEDVLFSNIDTSDDSIDSNITLSYAAIRDHGVDHVIENDGMRISLSDEVLQNKKKFIEDEENSEYILIPITKLDTDAPVFNAILDTEEISKYLSALIGSIDRTQIEKFGSFDELVAMINKIVYDSGFVNNIIHTECIVYSMVRDVFNDCVRPDWSKDGEVPYKLLKVSTAIERKDMYTAIMYQGLRRIFKTTSIRYRQGKSLFDSFFRITSLY